MIRRMTTTIGLVGWSGATPGSLPRKWPRWLRLTDSAQRGLFCRTDEECAQTIASSPRFEREFIEATAQLPADEDDICSVVADPILRKLLKPTDE